MPTDFQASQVEALVFSNTSDTLISWIVDVISSVFVCKSISRSPARESFYTTYCSILSSMRQAIERLHDTTSRLEVTLQTKVNTLEAIGSFRIKQLGVVMMLRLHDRVISRATWTSAHVIPPSLPRAKRRFSSEVTKSFELLYQEEEFPALEKKQELVARHSVTFEQVSNWFSLRRYRKKNVAEKSAKMLPVANAAVELPTAEHEDPVLSPPRPLDELFMPLACCPTSSRAKATHRMCGRKDDEVVVVAAMDHQPLFGNEYELFLAVNEEFWP